MLSDGPQRRVLLLEITQLLTKRAIVPIFPQFHMGFWSTVIAPKKTGDSRCSAGLPQVCRLPHWISRTPICMCQPRRLAHLRTHPAGDERLTELVVRMGAGSRFLDQPQRTQNGPDAVTTICRGPDPPQGGDRGTLTREGNEHGAVCSTPGRVGSCTRRGMDESVRPHGQYGSPHTVLPFSHEVYPSAPSSLLQAQSSPDIPRSSEVGDRARGALVVDHQPKSGLGGPHPRGLSLGPMVGHRDGVPHPSRVMGSGVNSPLREDDRGIMVVQSNNTTIVAYPNRQGGNRSPRLCLHALRLIGWCKSQAGYVESDAHCGSHLHPHGQSVPRQGVGPTEWSPSRCTAQGSRTPGIRCGRSSYRLGRDNSIHVPPISPLTRVGAKIGGSTAMSS